MKGLLVRLLVLLLSMTFGVMAGDEPENKSLQGLQGVYIIVERLDSDAEQAGIHESDIQTDVELKLRLAGIMNLPPRRRVEAGREC